MQMYLDWIVIPYKLYHIFERDQKGRLPSDDWFISQPHYFPSHTEHSSNKGHFCHTLPNSPWTHHVLYPLAIPQLQSHVTEQYSHTKFLHLEIPLCPWLPVLLLSQSHSFFTPDIISYLLILPASPYPGLPDSHMPPFSPSYRSC